jgi:arsenate reductase-like glutaredoxin family protein
VGQFQYDAIVAGGFAGALADGIRSRIEVKLSRYGLSFVDIQSATAKPQDGGISARQGELWLKTRENQLLRTAATIDNEQMQATASDIQKKIELRVALRAAVTDDRLNRVKNRVEFEKGIAEIDRDRLLRKEEQEALVAAYEQRKDDRDQLRAHLLATIDLQREQELEELRLAIDHAVRMKSLNQEIEQSRLSRTLDSEKWRAELEREREQVSERLAQRHREVKSRWERIREARQQRRDDSWEALLHAQRSESIKTDVELARADRQRQLALVQAELDNRLAHEKLEIQKRQELWELEAREKKSVSQLERLQRIQEMNAQFAERQQRMQLEMENLKADSTTKREIERIQAMSGVGTEVLIATAGEANAALLADLKKHLATQDAVMAQASASPAAELNAERLKMYEQMNAAERAKAEAIAEVYKMALQAQTSSVNQMIGGLAQASTNSQLPVGMSAMMPPPLDMGGTWHVALNGQQSPPLSWSQVHQYLQSGQINAATMVWKAGLATWLPAGQVPELARYLTAQVAPLTSPPASPPGPPPV